MQSLLKSLVAVGALLIAWQVGRIENPTGRDMVAPGTPATPARVVPIGGQFRGMAIQLHGGADVYDHYSRLIPEIAALGADTVLLVVHGWQDHAGSLDLHLDPLKTADAKALGKLCDLARQVGLRTILMPVVLLDNPRNSEWRGKIIPPNNNWDEWFKRYTKFIVHFAKVAEEHKVTVLMVGSELVKSEHYTDRWRGVIEAVKQEYRGKLGYSANWDHYQTEKIAFWPWLDYVGMTSYYELAGGPNPKPEEVDASWTKIKAQIKTFADQVKKPVIFTEVGWCSQEGSAHEGWNYYANQKATTLGLKEQEMLYEAFLRNWGHESWIGGIIWWEWDTTPGGKDDFNYTPRSKPAEQVIRKWFGSKAATPLADKAGSATGGSTQQRG